MGALIDERKRRAATNVKYHLSDVGSGDVETLLCERTENFTMIHIQIIIFIND
jgi:hypothetical protein